MSGVQYILCINSGSSSLKFALYRMGDEDETLLARGAIEHIGLNPGRMWIRAGSKGSTLELSRDVQDHSAAVHEAFQRLEGLRLAKPSAVGHRVVHGGPARFQPAKIDTVLLAELKSLITFAPLHLPAQIECIDAVTGRFPQLPQVACFDTAFHRGMPELAQRFPLPHKFWKDGLRRYGFHGLSYEYVLSVLGTHGIKRIVIAHLGNGASMAAIYDGCPMDTTMGFTPTGGFLMGTRTGDLDPGVLIYLIKERGYTSAQIEHLVNEEAGLLGISGTSPDMQTLLAQREQNPHAALAIDMFCYQVRKNIGALAAALGGLDMLVFTGGIGEKASTVRLAVCQGLTHLGIRLDEARNAAHADTISAVESMCTVRIIPTNEDLVIARHAFRLLAH